MCVSSFVHTNKGVILLGMPLSVPDFNGQHVVELEARNTIQPQLSVSSTVRHLQHWCTTPGRNPKFWLLDGAWVPESARFWP